MTMKVQHIWTSKMMKTDQNPTKYASPAVLRKIRPSHRPYPSKCRSRKKHITFTNRAWGQVWIAELNIVPHGGKLWKMHIISKGFSSSTHSLRCRWAPKRRRTQHKRRSIITTLLRTSNLNLQSSFNKSIRFSNSIVKVPVDRDQTTTETAWPAHSATLVTEMQPSLPTRKKWSWSSRSNRRQRSLIRHMCPHIRRKWRSSRCWCPAICKSLKNTSSCCQVHLRFLPKCK